VHPSAAGDTLRLALPSAVRDNAQVRNRLSGSAMSRAGTDEEVGTDASWRQFFGSLVCAALLLPWFFGIDRLPRDAGDAASLAIFLGLCWLITWRAWPAVEIAWETFASPEARRAYLPTWPHALGALGLGVGFLLAPALFQLPLSTSIEFDPAVLARRLLVNALIFYIAWPALVVGWRRLRTGNL
jgi:hypothetical protein